MTNYKIDGSCVIEFKPWLDKVQKKKEAVRVAAVIKRR